MTQNKTRLDALTGIRGLAAWFVMLFHVAPFFTKSLPTGMLSLMSKGNLAVDLFFILSGFVMWLTYAEQFERDGLKALRPFLVRRIARIYPLHFVMLVATFIFAMLVVVAGKPLPDQYPMNALPYHLLLIQNWGFTDRLAWNNPAWSISTEFAAYILLPFVAVFLLRFKFSISTCVGGILGLAALMSAFFHWFGYSTLGEGFINLGLARCLIEFFCGVLLCMIWTQRKPGFEFRLLSGSIGIALISLILWQRGTWSETFAVPILFANLVYCLAATSDWKWNPLSSRFAVHIGDISYSIYLVHFLLWVWFNIVTIPDAQEGSLIHFFLFQLLTYAVSLLLYHRVEQPGRHWMQRKMGG
jgi:peptidoglycan/LPS O-acetylase OafA/YrhL